MEKQIAELEKRIAKLEGHAKRVAPKPSTPDKAPTKEPDKAPTKE
jgi:hypothetical protein